jgi:hypothetical protein
MSSPASNLVNKVWNYCNLLREDGVLLKRDKANLDIFWLRDDSLGDSSDLPDPAVLAAEIVEDLQAALDQFAQIASDLAGTDSGVKDPSASAAEQS